MLVSVSRGIMPREPAAERHATATRLNETVLLGVAGRQTWQNSRPESGTTEPSRALQARDEVSKDGGVRADMATDYDSPRKTEDDVTEDSLQELQARRMDKSSTAIDIDPDDVAESLELPGADLSNEELSFRVIPRQADEFTCSSCFLVHHRSQLADNRGGQLVCRECAA
jgi:Domain of unknown function (DUF4193)